MPIRRLVHTTIAELTTHVGYLHTFANGNSSSRSCRRGKGCKTWRGTVCKVVSRSIYPPIDPSIYPSIHLSIDPSSFTVVFPKRTSLVHRGGRNERRTAGLGRHGTIHFTDTIRLGTMVAPRQQVCRRKKRTWRNLSFHPSIHAFMHSIHPSFHPSIQSWMRSNATRLTKHNHIVTISCPIVMCELRCPIVMCE